MHKNWCNQVPSEKSQNLKVSKLHLAKTLVMKLCAVLLRKLV